MADIDQYIEWCKHARRLLSIRHSEGPKALKTNAEGVAELLKKLQNSNGEQTPEGKRLLSEDEFKRLKKEYIRLATAAREADNLVSNRAISEKEGQRRVKDVSRKLRNLQQRLELAIGSNDPRATPEVRKRVLEVAKTQPIYVKDRERVEEALAGLRELAGCAAEIRELEVMLQVANDAVPDYAAASKALAKYMETYDKGIKAPAEFSKGGKDQKLKEALAKVHEAIRNYELIAGIGDSERITAVRNKIQSQLKRVESADPTSRTTVSSDVAKELNRLSDELDKQSLSVKKGQNLIDNRMQAFSNVMLELQQFAPESEVVSLLSSFNSLRSLYSAQRYADAEKVLTELEDKSGKLHETQTKARDSWLEQNKALDGYLKMLAEAGGDERIWSIGNSLQTMVTMTLRSQLVPAHRYKEAVELVQKSKLLEDFAKLAKLWNDIKSGKVKPDETPDLAFEGDSSKARAAVAKLQPAFETGTKRVDQAIADLEEAGGYTQPFRDKLGQLVSDWRQRNSEFINAYPATKTPDGKDIPELAERAKQSTKALSDLVEQIETLLKDSDSLEESVEVQKEVGKRGDFNSARIEALKSLDYLRDLDDPTNALLTSAKPPVEQMVRNLKALDSAAEASPPKFDVDAMKLIGTLAGEVVKKIKALEVDQRKEVATISEEVKGKLAQMRKDHKSHAAFFDRMDREFFEASGLAGSALPKLMTQGLQALKALQTRVASLETELGKKDGENFAKVSERKKAIEKKLGNADLKDYDPRSHGRLKAEFENRIPTVLVPMSPAEALQELNRFEKELDQAIQAVVVNTPAVKETPTKAGSPAVKGTKALHDGLAAAGKEMLKKLEAIKTTAPTVYAVQKQAIETAMKSSKSEASAGTRAIENVGVLLEGLEKDKKRLAELEESTLKAQYAAELEAAQFESAVGVFEKGWGLQAQTVYKDFGLISFERNSDLYDQIDVLLKAAKKNAKSGAYLLANGKLREAEAVARAFIANPHVPAVAARRALEAGNTRWKQAVATYLRQLGALRDAIDSACKIDKTPEKSTAAAEVLNQLDGLFDANAFARAVGALSKPMKDRTEIRARRQIKEFALLDLRRYRRLLAEHAVLKNAVANPFSEVSVQPLLDALRDLDGALLVS